MAIFGFVVLVAFGVYCAWWGLKLLVALPVLVQLSPGATWTCIAVTAFVLAFATCALVLAFNYAPFEITWHAK